MGYINIVLIFIKGLDLDLTECNVTVASDDCLINSSLNHGEDLHDLASPELPGKPVVELLNHDSLGSVASSSDALQTNSCFEESEIHQHQSDNESDDSDSSCFDMNSVSPKYRFNCDNRGCNYGPYDPNRSGPQPDIHVCSHCDLRICFECMHYKKRHARHKQFMKGYNRERDS